MGDTADQYKDRSVLITGGVGFIGSHLARRLAEAGSQVTLVDSLIPEYGGNLYNIRDIVGNVNLNVCDVRDRHAMEYLIQGHDFLFNLAGQTSHADSMVDPHTDLEINTKAQISILEACKKHNQEIRIVFASTRQIYGKPDYLPVDEKHPIRPADANGINKWAGEYYHLLYNDVYGIKSCALRLTNTYGPGMRVKDARQTFLGIWVWNLLHDLPIQVFGDGSQLRDFNFVSDVVEALLLCGVNDSAVGRIFNLGGRERVSLGAVAEMMTSLSGNGTYETVTFPPERKVIDIGDYYSDFTLIEETLGWSPVVSLEDGLRETIEYYRDCIPDYG